MIAMETTVQEQVAAATEPSDVAMALFAAGRCVLHVDGRCVTCSIDGEYVSGVADGWADVVAMVDTAVSRFVQQYMADVVEPDMGAWDLANDTARYFGLGAGQATTVQLLDWAQQVANE